MTAVGGKRVFKVRSMLGMGPSTLLLDSPWGGLGHASRAGFPHAHSHAGRREVGAGLGHT